MNRKITGLALCAVLFALCCSVDAQQPAKIPRIGYISGTGDASNPGPNVEAFRQGLRDLGYVEEKNILIEYRYVEGNVDRIPSLVAELVQLKVDVLVSPNTPVIRAAKQATETIPIVMVIADNPVTTGIVNSLAHPAEISQDSPHSPEN